MTEVPKFQLSKSKYDQSTFYGRLRHFMDVIDPRTLLASAQDLQASIELLDAFKRNALPPGVTDEMLWNAQKIKQAIIHPDTGEKIFAPFRMSGFVPFGSPIVVGLLLPNPTLPKTMFWQWFNQTHNACINYANRNATKETPMSQFLLGYCGAVSSAVGIAVALNLLIKRANTFSPATKMLVQRFVPFPAVSCASVCNVVLMRSSELSIGIEVFNEQEELVGTSQVAAKQALKETALTRAFLPAPIFLIPPFLMTMLEKTHLLRSNPRLHLPVQAVITTITFGAALPVAIALFPQISSFPVGLMEPHIQKAAGTSTRLFYNKGL